MCQRMTTRLRKSHRLPLTFRLAQPLLIKLIKPALIIFAGFVAIAPASEMTERLDALDDLKVVNVAQFSEKLAVIAENAGKLTQYEYDYLELLQSYEMSLRGDFDGAAALLESMLARDTEPEIVFRVKALLVNVFAVTRNYRNAFSYLEQISREVQSVTSTRAKEHGLSVLAYTYNQLSEFDIARFYAQVLIDSATSEKTLCHARHHLIESLYGLGQWELFSTMVESSVSHCVDNRELIFANLIRLKYFNYLLQTEQYRQADKYYDSFIDSVTKTNYPFLLAGVLGAGAQNSLALAEYNIAEERANRTLQHSGASEFSLPVLNAYYVLYQVNYTRQNFNKALEYHVKYTSALKANSDDRFVRQQAYHVAKAEIEVKDQRLALLDKDNELLFLQKNLYQQEVKQNRLIMLLLLLIVALASFMAYRGMSGRSRFKKIAEYDQLTGISNRYHFNNQARVALDYCELDAKPAALILFDLDHFKNINDRCGHATGDWALQQVVKTCRNFMRNNDVFGRIGGEEFAVVLPGCHADKAALMAEICRDAIATIDTKASGCTFPLSASFGVSSSDTSGYQLKQLLADADLAMYKAKQSGRDQVSMYTEELG